MLEKAGVFNGPYLMMMEFVRIDLKIAFSISQFMEIIFDGAWKWQFSISQFQNQRESSLNFNLEIGFDFWARNVFAT